MAETERCLDVLFYICIQALVMQIALKTEAVEGSAYLKYSIALR